MDTKYQRYTPEEWMKARPDKTHLAFYITYRENVLPDALCDSLVKLYDSNPQLHVTKTQGEHFKFDQLNLTEAAAKEPFHSIHQEVCNHTVQAVQQYFVDVDAYDANTRIPANCNFEQFRINRTNNNGKDGFGWHTDVCDYASARRFVTVLYYLDDIDVGGDAAFPMLGLSCYPKKGALLCFPSTWQWLHCGLKPISNPKYIMTTFCHYL